MLSFIDKTNRLLGRIAAWFALLMMLSQGIAVLLRYVFNYGLIGFQEAVIYGHASLFLLGAAYVLQLNGHVRVDIFYNKVMPATRRIIDIVALLVFVLPVAIAIGWYSFPYVAASWMNLEGSRQVGGVPAVFILKTAMLVFAVSLALQALSLAVRMMTGTQPHEWTPDQATEDSGGA